jgi:hypothetical protein
MFMSLIEMAAVSPQASGVAQRLFFSWAEYAGTTKPSFRVEISQGNVAMLDLHPICPDGLPVADFDKIMRFIELNHRTILDYWESKITDPEFHARLKEVQ